MDSRVTVDKTLGKILFDHYLNILFKLSEYSFEKCFTIYNDNNDNNHNNHNNRKNNNHNSFLTQFRNIKDRKMTIIIIGHSKEITTNNTNTTNYSSYINNADLVIRFNDKHDANKTGNKTHILVDSAINDTLDFKGIQTFLKPQKIQQQQQLQNVFMLRSPQEEDIDSYQYYLNCSEISYLNYNFYNHLKKHLQILDIQAVSAELFMILFSVVYLNKNRNNIVNTIGIDLYNNASPSCNIKQEQMLYQYLLKYKFIHEL
jgi:hypothetical protein